MIKNELHALWHNKLLMVVLLVIILIPAMYAGFFLASMWDPYGDLEYLPVAVVNKDKAVTYQDEELTIGADLAENLEDNTSMAFHVVDEKTAQTGLEDGTYYMVITIPENFSKNASTLMEDEPQKMQLIYQTNPGKNYISMKLSESAMKEVKENLTREVTHTYVESVFGSLTDIEDGFGEAVDGTDEMLDGEKELLDGNGLISENLLVLTDGAKELNNGMNTVKTGSSTLAEGAEQVSGGVDTLSKSLYKLTGSLGTNIEEQESQEYKYKKSVNKDKKAVTNAVTDYATSVATASAGAAATDAATAAATVAAGSAATTASTIAAGSAATAAAQVAAGEAVSASAPVAAGVAANEAATVAAGVAGKAAAGTAASVAAPVAANTAIKTVMSTVETSLSNLPTAFINYEASQGVDVTAMTQEQLLAAYTQYIGSTLSGMAADPSMQANISNAVGTAVQSEMTKAETNTAITSAVMEQMNAKETKAAITAAVTSKLQSAETQEQLTTTVTTQMSSKETQKKITDAVTSQMQSAETQGKITSAVTAQMQSKDTQKSITDTVTEKMQSKDTQTKITSAVKKVDTKGVTQAVSNLANDSGQLGGATGALTVLNTVNKQADLSQLPVLVDGAKAVADGAARLSGGTTKLSDGAMKIADGSKQLSDGSKELGDGLATLRNGTRTLRDALADGKDEIAENEASDETLDMFAEPVVTEETQITQVENNGHAMAAYMFSVGIWVACLAFCLMYPLARYTGELTNGKDWWASKAVILYPMAILMVVMLFVIMHFALGFEPASLTKTFAVALAAVACFMSIMYFFNLLLGKVGSFLMLLFMVLQLAGSAGTYPVEISGKLAQALNPWMPFTYSVNGFRAGIAANGPSVVHECVVLFAISIVFTLLTIGVFRIRSLRSKQGKPFLYDWLEEKGLA